MPLVKTPLHRSDFWIRARIGSWSSSTFFPQGGPRISLPTNPIQTRFVSSNLSTDRPCLYTANSSYSRTKRAYGSPFSSQQHHIPVGQGRRNSNAEKRHDRNAKSQNDEFDPGTVLIQDRLLPCGDHLDPDGTMLPKSEWIRVIGTLPIGSLNQMLNSMKQMLLEEEQKGIIDLDAEWNPFIDAQVPLISLGDVSVDIPLIQAAHVILSPFGRPTGWRLKLANRSLVYAILARGEQEQLRVGWKVVTMEEYQYSKEREQSEDPAFTHNEGLIVDDSMVRIENCPFGMDANYVRYMMSRYELAHEGNTILQWRGTTNDGKVAPLMFIVRFASASWARAAIRECQATQINGKTIKLVQYPKQIRYQEP